MLTRLLAIWNVLTSPLPPVPSAPVKAAVVWNKAQVAETMSGLLRENVFESAPQWNYRGERYVAQLTLRPDLQKRGLAILREAKAEYAAIAVIDAVTGAVKVLLSQAPKDDGKYALALRATFPAASVFKLVTAAAGIEEHLARPETAITFRGGDHELYHFSVDHSRGKARSMSLRHAFALSVNPVFARLGAEMLGRQKLFDYGARFGFGEKVPADFFLEVGQLGLTDAEWSLAETASGYNWRTQMSPVQAATFTAAIINDGQAMEPYLVDTAITASGDVLYRGQPRPWRRLVTAASSGLLRELMRETVKAGTARTAFGGFRRGIEVGGKTGTIQNLVPRGRCDWFAGYAANDEEKLGFAVLVVHTRPGQAKAAAIARALLAAYFNPRNVASERTADITLRTADFVEIDE